MRDVEGYTSECPGKDEDGEDPQLSFESWISYRPLRVAAGPDYTHYSMNVVSCAPSSATNTAISSAGSVALAFADTRWVAPGGSKND